MSAVATKILLASSTNGKGIKIVATSGAGSGTAIHQVSNSTTVYDECWIYATNNDTVDRILTIEFGGTTATDNTIVQTIPTKAGLFCCIPGICLDNNLAITGFSDATNVVVVYGFCNRITI